MPSRVAHICPQRAAIEALVEDGVSDGDRAPAERHLEHCLPCRTLFRQRTAARYPRIRNYTIVRELGRGGFGVVYKALHHSKERAEALKVLFGDSPQRAAYFENEVKLAAKLRHPNIATVYDASLRSAPLYYAMELVDGEQLDEHIRSHPATLEQRIELVRNVADAVGYAHGQGVIHRDLKPQNILVDGDARPHIVDFGISKRFGPGSADMAPVPVEPAHEGALGTFGYIAPEQLAGGEVDARADVYSLGALLFHVITGEPAKRAQDASHLARILREREVARAEDLAAILACCLRPVADQRYGSCAELVADLDRYLAGQEVRARQDTTAGSHLVRMAALLVRNHPAAVQAGAGAVAVVLLTVAFWLFGMRWSAPGGKAGETVIVALKPSTLAELRSGRFAAELPDLDASIPKSRRLLFGRLTAALGAARPRVIVWDYFFPDSQPEYDADFIAGIQAAGVPVVVGTEDWDLNGDPLLAPEIKAVVHAWGKLQAAMQSAGAVAVPLAAKRGFNPALPALALAGFAAARHPECDAEIGVLADRLEVRYRQQHPKPGALRYLPDTDCVPVFKMEEHDEDGPGPRPADRWYFGQFAYPALPEWTERALALEDVLVADAAQRRRWFEGRAVIVGQMVPGVDQRPCAPGKLAFGCQWQASILDDLLAQRYVQRMSRGALAWRVALGYALGVLAAWLWPTPRDWRLRRVDLAAGVVALTGVALAVLGPRDGNSRGMAEVLVAASALLVGAAVSWCIQVHHRRAGRLTPRPVWSAEATTLSTTVAATGSVSATGPANSAQMQAVLHSPRGLAANDRGLQCPDGAGPTATPT